MSSPVVAGKYELLRRLGKGGMAEVFLAKQRGQGGFEKLVVIKRILPHLADNHDFVTMFLDEARTAADLRHPNVVNIFEIGEDGGTYYMVMEFLHGQDIRKIQRQAVKESQRIPLQHALQIIIDAANGLHYAHTKVDLSGQPLNIVHRDVSPQNIICTYEGATKIVDFGIAKASVQNTETATGIVKGKYTYMSPEQAGGDKIDHRTDQFALGIVLWELVTMRRLFKRENEIQTLAAITGCDVPPPGEFVDIPSKLNAIIMKTLSKDRRDRFVDCQAMMTALEDFLAEERLVHSPARLGGFMQELFTGMLREESELGVGQLDGQSISQVSNFVPAATQVGRQNNRSQTGGPGMDASSTNLLSDDTNPPGETPSTRTGTRSTVADRTTPLASVTATIAEDHASGGKSSMMAAGIGVAVTLVIVAMIAAWMFLAKGTGQIVVRTSPSGATVYLDGKIHYEKTPTVIREVAVGELHQVKVVLEGYEPFMFTAELKESGSRTELSQDLEPEKKGAQTATKPVDKPEPIPPVKEPVDTPEPKPDANDPPADSVDEPEDDKQGGRRTRRTRRPARRSTTTAKPADATPATLKVVVKPWAKVYVDGEYLDQTPFPAKKIAPGKHKIKLVNPELGKSETKTYTFKPGEEVKISRDWQ